MKRPTPINGRNPSRAYVLRHRVDMLEHVFGKHAPVTLAACARLCAALGQSPSLFLWAAWGDAEMAAWAREAGHAGHMNRGSRRARARARALAAEFASYPSSSDDYAAATSYAYQGAWQ